MKSVKFCDLPSNLFQGCSADDFDSNSCFQFADIGDLSVRCHVSIMTKKSNKKFLSIVKVGKVNQWLNLKLLLTESEIEFGDFSQGIWDIRSWHGSKFSMAGSNHQANIKCVIQPGGKVSIGKNCMFSDDILIQCGDQHAVISASDKCQINADDPVINIKDRVW